MITSLLFLFTYSSNFHTLCTNIFHSFFFMQCITINWLTDLQSPFISTAFATHRERRWNHPSPENGIILYHRHDHIRGILKNRMRRSDDWVNSRIQEKSVISSMLEFYTSDGGIIRSSDAFALISENEFFYKQYREYMTKTSFFSVGLATQIYLSSLLALVVHTTSYCGWSMVLTRKDYTTFITSHCCTADSEFWIFLFL